MTEINRLRSTDTLSSGDLVAIYSTTNGGTRKAPASAFVDAIGQSYVDQAEAQADAATATVSAFQNLVYPGVYAVDPTTRPNGSAMQDGDRAVVLVGGVPTEKLRVLGAWIVPNVDAVNLALSSGSSLVGFVQSGAGAIARTVQDKGREFITPFDFGATGDGVTDDTVAVQNMRDAAAVLGKPCNGLGRLFVVTSVNWGTGDIVRDFRFKTKGGSADFVAPITINGLTTPQTRIRFYNVAVDGNRQNQTAITGPAEDGGRHCWRILGRVSDLVIEDCSGIYGAGDGIEFFSSSAKNPTTDADFCFSDIIVRRSTFDWNRRHGGSADSIQGVKFEQCNWKNNGKDLNGTDPLDHGNRGARIGGNLYGHPFDLETYGVGSAFDGVWFTECDCRDNITGFLVHESTADPTTPGFIARQNLFVTRCLLNGPSVVDYPFNTFGGAYAGVLPMFKNIRLIDCTITDGRYVLFSLCDGASDSGTHTVTSGTAGSVFDRCTNHFSRLKSNVDGTSTNFGTVDDRSAPTTAAVGVDQVPSASSWKIIGYAPTGGPIWRYKATWTPAGTGFSIFRMTFPTSSQLMRGAIALNINASGVPILTSIYTSPTNSYVVDAAFSFTAAAAHVVEITVEMKGG